MIGTKPKNDSAAEGRPSSSGLMMHALNNQMFAPVGAPKRSVVNVRRDSQAHFSFETDNLHLSQYWALMWDELCENLAQQTILRRQKEPRANRTRGSRDVHNGIVDPKICSRVESCTVVERALGVGLACHTERRGANAGARCAGAQ